MPRPAASEPAASAPAASAPAVALPSSGSPALDALWAEIRACRACPLPHDPRPVLRPSATARLLIAGQAPGTRVHRTGLPWNDPSGDRLRAWLGMDRATFYDLARVAIVPIGLCYPGHGPHGDLPPRPECAPRWQPALAALQPQVGLVLAIGAYSQAWWLGAARGRTLTETVRAYRRHLPRVFPLPHPSPRNGVWLRANPWFEAEVVPALRAEVAALGFAPAG